MTIAVSKKRKMDKDDLKYGNNIVSFRPILYFLYFTLTKLSITYQGKTLINGSCDETFVD
jgi:hypothetical protein